MLAGERVGDDQRRRHEVVGADIDVDAALEVAVAGEHADGDQAVLFDGLRDVGGQRAGVADAGGAAVADDVEAELFEVGEQAGLLVVVGDDAGAGRERGLDPRRHGEAFFDGLLGEQAGGDHDGGVGGVGAAGDGGDDDGAVVEIGVGIDAEACFDGGGDGDRRRSRWPFVIFGCYGGVGDRLALPRGGGARAERLGGGREQRGQLLGKAGGRLFEQDAILRALGAGHAGLDGGEVELEGLGVLGFGRVGGVEEALLVVVGLDEGDVFFAAAGEAQVAQGFGVDGEDAAGGAVLGRHVADGGAVGEGQLGDAGAVELDELADDAELAQRLGDGEDEVGGGGAFAQLAGELEADDLRDEHGDGLAEHGGFGLDAADAPAEDAEAVDHGGVGVGADQRVGIGGEFAVDLRGEDDAGEVFEIDLVADAHAGRNGGEVAEGGLAPLEEGVALAVALELEQRVEVVGDGGAELVDLDGVVDDQLGGRERIDSLRSRRRGS